MAQGCHFQNYLGSGAHLVKMTEKSLRRRKLQNPPPVSRCTKIPESLLFVFNPFPGFKCILAALKSRTAHKTRTKFLLKFVRDISTKMTLSSVLASVSVRDLSTNSSADSGI
jgi:hypothetical protein